MFKLKIIDRKYFENLLLKIPFGKVVFKVFS